ncbi:MAG: tetratricopeptide repeat protein [Flavobacteriales bacterium]|nr:tetratricopeptide repeat protein [Flavobacteriales bacterium]
MEQARGSVASLMAEAKAKLSRMPEALAACDSAVWYAEKVATPTVLAEADVIRGQVYVWSGDLDRASRCYETALTLFFKSGNRSRAAYATRELGWVLYLQRHFDLAMERYRDALAEYRRLNDRGGMARVFRSMGLVHCDTSGDKTYRTCVTYFDSSIAICKEINDHYGLAATHSNMGSVFMYQDMLDRSKAHFDTALIHARESGDARLLASVSGTAGEYYLHTARPDEALRICSATMEAARSSGMLTLERDAALCVYNALRLLGKDRKANTALLVVHHTS